MAAERYHRQLILNGFGESAQSLLSKARVLVIGAGGLGCPALQYLAAAGVGTLGIVDDDTISLSNLHRQVLFTEADLGKLKVSVAQARLKAMNPEISITSHAFRLQQDNMLELLKCYDYIFDGTDNFESRYLINDACTLLNKPLIFAAVSAYEGQIAVFNCADSNGTSTNYRDLFPVSPAPGEIKNCAENGVLGVLPGIIGTMAAAEIIKLITSIGKPLINKLLHYNVLTTAQYEVNISPGTGYTLLQTESEFLNMNDTNTDAHTTAFIEIDINQLAEIQQQANTIMIDVRENHEFPKLDSQVYQNIPMSEFKNFLNSDVAAQNIVLICQHGIRSVAAAEALHDKYGESKRLFSLKGGIAKWRNHFLTV